MALLPSLNVGSPHRRNGADGLTVLVSPDVKASYGPFVCVFGRKCSELGGSNGTHPIMDQLVGGDSWNGKRNLGTCYEAVR